MVERKFHKIQNHFGNSAFLSEPVQCDSSILKLLLPNLGKVIQIPTYSNVGDPIPKIDFDFVTNLNRFSHHSSLNMFTLTPNTPTSPTLTSFCISVILIILIINAIIGVVQERNAEQALEVCCLIAVFVFKDHVGSQRGTKFSVFIFFI
jgi:hypothetical protein